MSLSQALSGIVGSFGAVALRDNSLLNLLVSDHAFDEMPAAKHSFAVLIADGYMDDVIAGYDGGDLDAAIERVKRDLDAVYGIKPEIVSLVAQALRQARPQAEASFGNGLSIHKDMRATMEKFGKYTLCGKALADILEDMSPEYRQHPELGEVLQAVLSYGYGNRIYNIVGSASFGREFDQIKSEFVGAGHVSATRESVDYIFYCIQYAVGEEAASHPHKMPDPAPEIKINPVVGEFPNKQKQTFQPSESLEDIYSRGVDYADADDYKKAVECYRKAAEGGHPAAMCNLGWCYEMGKGVAENINEAVKWYRKSAEAGNQYAQSNLAYCYQEGNGVRQDYNAAVEWYRKAANQGNLRAMNSLGFCYENGQGVQQSWVYAADWYRKAAEGGYANGQCNLGWCYEYGRGVGKDYNKAYEWYRKAAEQGLARAQFNVGVCYENSIGVTENMYEAAHWYKLAADQGYASALCNLGLCYERGAGVKQDWQMAADLYRQSGENGNANGQCNYGWCLENGKGVGRDMREAFRWYKRAADQGLARGQCNVGTCYYNGAGINKDTYEARYWWRKSADQGYQNAIENLNKFFK